MSATAVAIEDLRFGLGFAAARYRGFPENIPKVAQRATLYVTDYDQAIGLSRRLHAYPRAGLAPPVAMLPGVDTVVASGVDLGMWGLRTDMFQLMRSGTTPHQWFGLREVSVAGTLHWKFTQ